MKDIHETRARCGHVQCSDCKPKRSENKTNRDSRHQAKSVLKKEKLMIRL